MHKKIELWKRVSGNECMKELSWTCVVFYAGDVRGVLQMSVPLRTNSLCGCVPHTKVNRIKFSLTRTGLLGDVTSSQWLCWFRLVSSEVPLLELFEFLPLYKWISFLTDEVAMWESQSHYRVCFRLVCFLHPSLYSRTWEFSLCIAKGLKMWCIL